MSKQSILILMAIVSPCFLAPSTLAEEPEDTPTDKTDNWQLVWADEFNTDGRPNGKNWTYERGFVRHKEAQWYQPENAWCENGRLIIEARREQVPNPSFDAASNDWKRSRKFATHTSASLRTQGLHSWQYGRFEMRGRIDTRRGMWPTFWTMGDIGEWPQCGEVDIMEFYRGMLLANVAWGTETRWVPHWDSIRVPIEDFGTPDWSDEFHVWRMDWDESSIKIFVDDRLLNVTDLGQTINVRRPPRNPFQQRHYILLNLAIGGANGGDHTKTDFPARFEVDYVRVYQRVP